jgi:hypothetical protein
MACEYRCCGDGILTIEVLRDANIDFEMILSGCVNQENLLSAKSPRYTSITS